MNFLKNKRRLILIGLDIGIMMAAYAAIILADIFAADKLKLEPLGYAFNFAIFLILGLCVRFSFSCYSNVWRYANSLVFLKLIVADAISGLAATIITHFIPYVNIGAWESLSLFCMYNIATLCSRFVYQLYYKTKNANEGITKNHKIPAAILGAGQVGNLLAEEIIYDKTSKYQPVCFIDRDKRKVGGKILGLPVYSDTDCIEKMKKLGTEEVFIAITNLEEERTKALVDWYSKSGFKVKIYDFPLKSDGSSDPSSKRVIREVRIEDLLFRDMLSVIDSESRAYYENKVVLVTGGGGSIGSELCRQIAKCSPKKLVIFDIYENNAYDIEQELRRAYGEKLNLTVEIGSVRDRVRLEAVFSAYCPDVVFHAAAHKHVPLMEHSSCEAIKNNSFGTYNTADMAEKYGCEKFILISTDKAVNPTNVMGASKRLCEMIVQARSDSKTAFAAVRFGNVLGSNGSVIPLFKRQIAAGGPITITDRRIIRYFMTIPEASGLVMQAGAMAKCGELFVLDMGKPVKIIDLAENMVSLSGLRPYIDIDIIETGLRPGEKLYEELLIKTEKLSKTKNNLIFIEKDVPLSRNEVDEKLDMLRRVIEETESKSDSKLIKDAMMQVVPTYRTPEEINCKAKDSEEMKLAASASSN
ncbi:MAG: polysaccharide biosynthesis protein [Clostridia bacterium]|nr:polysaccharide biosynthesis protein [Clostridia bacterium]